MDAFQAAAASGDLAQLKRLFQTSKPDIDASTASGNTPLMLAAKGGHA